MLSEGVSKLPRTHTQEKTHCSADADNCRYVLNDFMCILCFMFYV
jgi:hypothetical protein